MEMVSRTAYYGFIQKQRAKKLPTKLERSIAYINEIEYMIENLWINGEQLAQCIEFGDESLYLIYE